ncbi:amidohydrolase family protein [Bradyrhizobium sp. NP1]|uniref:amidohydrolase family protein n=1 Tax=Bradyrhizobium sp. NP1 TaxID=3049772 RepID=UPI0025A537EF|nr:amidohydrolase family protein [Bradyrhizobium sp. NP1]WJR76715.1 amidohydrolase family protein [Bradyrhizobium sp. NP1]
MGRVLIKNVDWLITVDAGRTIYRHGAVGIADDRLEFVGKAEDLPPDYQADEVIDGSGHIALPGFIDTHVHNTQHLGRGLGDGCDMPVLLLERLYAYESVMTAEDAYWAARLCQLELIRSGTTCFLDPSSYYPDETARATGDSGMRGFVSRTAFDIQNTKIGKLPRRPLFRESTEEALDRAEETVVTYKNAHGGRVRAWLSIRIPVGCSDALCKGIRRLADKHKVGIVTHCCESHDQSVGSRRTSGLTDIERMEALDVLGPDMVMIQMGWANPNEIALAQKRGFKISYTPTTGYRIALGDATFGHFPEFAALGVTVALGGNAAMSSNHLDLVRVMGLGAGMMRSTRISPFIFPPEQMIEMATINGAVAVGMQDEIGSLEVGKKADLVLFDTRTSEWCPVHNPLSNLVHSSRGGANYVFVDGRLLMREGEITAFSEEETIREGQMRGLAIAERSGLDRIHRPHWSVR